MELLSLALAWPVAGYCFRSELAGRRSLVFSISLCAPNSTFQILLKISLKIKSSLQSHGGDVPRSLLRTYHVHIARRVRSKKFIWMPCPLQLKHGFSIVASLLWYRHIPLLPLSSGVKRNSRWGLFWSSWRQPNRLRNYILFWYMINELGRRLQFVVHLILTGQFGCAAEF